MSPSTDLGYLGGGIAEGEGPKEPAADSSGLVLVLGLALGVCLGAMAWVAIFVVVAGMVTP